MSDLRNISYFNKNFFYFPKQIGYKNLEYQYKSYVLDKTQILSSYIAEIFEIKNLCLDKAINVIPDGCDDIIIVYGENSIGSYLSPSLESIQSFTFSNEYVALGIRFFPGATANIFREDMCSILGYTPKVHHFLQDFNQVEELLIESVTFEQRCNILISYFEKKIKDKDSKQLIINHSINKIITSKGNYLIEDLSEETGYSTRYIRKLFNSYVGHNPKELSNIIRLQNMLNYIEKNPQDNLASIALNCGFSDQSHMNRESKRYLNTTVGNIRSNKDWLMNLSLKSKRIFY
ncbi:MAG TPA: hypothetical protein DDY58_19745 [Terrisporobacter glycolicus]|uniref:helix-turn-helix transcriptional regulator n=1 Tax=Terrisporobacter TaxID=1505652 RepID=UPI000E837784|nr:MULTISPECIES: helix-turn-helix transcriptional regulator [Terrisporobacter]HBI94480.1 hypothetical protein [Terrisporobacter hibernicus]